MNIRKKSFKKIAIIFSFLFISYMCKEITYTESFTEEELKNDKEMMKYLEEINFFEKVKENKQDNEVKCPYYERRYMTVEQNKDNDITDEDLDSISKKYDLDLPLPQENISMCSKPSGDYLIQIRTTVFKKYIRNIYKYFSNNNS